MCTEKLYKKAYKDIFVLTYDRMRRYEGIWHLERQLLFPGYIFLDSDNKEMLSEEIQRCNDILCRKYQLNQISQGEEELLKRLCKEEHHLAMSRGVISKGNTRITEGPLKGLENRIHRIDRHKRLARVDITGNPVYHYIMAGLEITEKVI